MARWDQKWKSILEENNITKEEDGLYVDDGRAWLYGLRAGWRWVNDGLWYCEEWEQEDKTKTLIHRTVDVVKDNMVGLTKCLEFTVESEEDYPDGFIPTLDLATRVNKNHRIFICCQTDCKYVDPPARHSFEPELSHSVPG